MEWCVCGNGPFGTAGIGSQSPPVRYLGRLVGNRHLADRALWYIMINRLELQPPLSFTLIRVDRAVPDSLFFVTVKREWRGHSQASFP